MQEFENTAKDRFNTEEDKKCIYYNSCYLQVRTGGSCYKTCTDRVIKVDLEAIAAQIREDVAKMDKKQTNYEKIHSMGIEELAEFLICVETEAYHDRGVSGDFEMVEWLQQEVRET